MLADSILVKNDRDPLAGLGRADFEARLRAALSGRVLEAWLFGSYVSGGFGPDSDVDLMLVRETDEPFVQRPFAFADLLDIGPRLDILVYTPGEFATLVSDPSPGFWKNVVRSLRRFA
jgi:predicted nucleotidyltransferase